MSSHFFRFHITSLKEKIYLQSETKCSEIICHSTFGNPENSTASTMLWNSQFERNPRYRDMHTSKRKNRSTTRENSQLEFELNQTPNIYMPGEMWSHISGDMVTKHALKATGYNSMQGQDALLSS